MIEYILNLQQLNTLCQHLPKNGIILLRGNLASGKTTLVKCIAKYLNIFHEVTSPTFSILQSYDDRLFHYDIYQEKTAGFIRQGLYENLEKKGLHVIEWGDEEFEKMLKNLGYKYTIINISPFKNKRKYEVKSA